MNWLFFGDPLLAELLSIANFSLALLLGVMSLVRAKKLAGFDRSITVLFGIVGIYWFFVYLYVAVTPANTGIDAVVFGRWFVRPAFTLTLGLMASRSLSMYRKTSALKGGQN